MAINSKLSEHKFKKGKFITPFNELTNVAENSWFHCRMPEYIWLGLVIKYYGRDEGLIKCNRLLKKVSEYSSSIYIPRFSDILNLPDKNQLDIYKSFKEIVDMIIFAPLTVIFTYSSYPCFASFFHSELSTEDRIGLINNVITEASHHQADFSTDLRFLVLYYQLLTNKFHMPEETLKQLLEYPTLSHRDEKMRMIRPVLRAMEIARPLDEDNNSAYMDTFWEGVSRLSDCEMFFVQIEPNHADAELYLSKVKSALQYYTEILTSARPLDNKMLVMLGIATYSFKRLLEVAEHDLYQTIAGRGTVRLLVENYIMLKYLLKNEPNHEDIWAEYQYYGIGQYKLIVERYRESGNDLPYSHVMYDYMDLLVGEYKNKEFIDMDTSYFDKKNIREKSLNVGEKELFGLYYDYDSAFEHGLWGAIRESSLLKCNSPSHQFHCVPDIDNQQKLKDVWHDCEETMNKIMLVLKDTYGLPDYFNEGEKSE